jgi:hypothetical protein
MFSICTAVTIMFRLEIQGHIWQSAKLPSEAHQSQLHWLHKQLTAKFAALDALLIDEPIRIAGLLIPFQSQDDFENLDDEIFLQGPIEQADSNMITIENRPLPLPSYRGLDKEISAIELRLRQQQASRILLSIRTTIADKLFQYSHVLRVAPCKSVKTRARSAIAKLNSKIATNGCIYTRCRSAMVRLGADASILDRYQPLTRADVKASTALLNPNIPGSSSIRLSWIWQNGSLLPTESSDSLLECTFFFPNPDQLCLINVLGSSTCALAASKGSERSMGRRI